MATPNKPDMSCARVQQYQSSNIGTAERHNERKNQTYENLNVMPERIAFNVHFRDPGESSYMEILRRLEAEGKVSTRGLRQDATLFDEIIIDVNTMYFERNGGYEYAKKFYEEAYRFIEKKFGSQYVISAVMHADELNKAATEDLGREIYHYHLHAVVLPVVEKEIRWSKRCKDPALRGTVKEVIHQISHSKKWASTVPLRDEQGQPVLRKNGKPKFRPSYSVLQDELFDHMQEHGFTGFQRGELGSTAENLKSLQYQIQKDRQRLEDIQERIQAEELKYEPVYQVFKTVEEIDRMGQKTLTGKVAVTKEDYRQLTALAKEGVTSRSEIHQLKKNVDYYQERYYRTASTLERLQRQFDQLKEKCQPFLEALEHFPKLVKAFVGRWKQLVDRQKEQERRDKERAEEKRRAELLVRKQKKRDRGWER